MGLGGLIKTVQNYINFKDGIFHQFKEINQAEVKMFTMYNTDPNSNARFEFWCEGEVQFFHFYRNFI